MDRPVPMAALAFGAGVLGVPLSWIAGGVCLLLVRDGRQRRRRLHPSVPSYSGFAGLVLLVAAAALGSLRARQEAQGLAALRNGAAWMDGREEALEGTVLDAPADTRGGCRVLLGLRDPSNTLVQLQIACPCPPYRPGDVLRGRARFLSWKPPANPGEFDLGSYRRARGIAGLAVCSLPPFLVGFDTEHPGSVAGLVADLRGRIRRGLDGAELSPDAAGLALALVVGDRSSVPDELGRDFSRSGLAHLLAISGLHLALTAGLVLSLARLVLLPMARRLSPGWLLGAPYAVLVPVVCLQTALAGAPPSCLRAATMIIHLCAARLLGRRGDSASSLGLAALVCLSVQPSALREAGFQLSFAATAAILWIPPPAPSPGAAWWRRLARSAFGLLRVSLAATLGTAPLVAWHFGTLPVLGPLANLVAVPVASLALLPAALLAGTWSGATGTAPPLPLSMVLEAACGIEALAARTASIEGWVLPMLPRDLPGLVLAGGAGLLVLRHGLRCTRARVPAAAGLLALLLSAFPPPPGRLDAWLLDVGEGNLSVVRFPTGEVLVLDGGPRGSGRRTLLPFLRSRGIRRVHGIVVSHGHDDHYAGAAEVYRDLGRPSLLTNGSPLIHRAFGMPPPPGPTTGSAVPFSHARGIGWVTLEVQSPAAIGPLREENDRSLVVFLTWPGGGIVFPADLGPRGWALVAPQAPEGTWTLMQVPHHGHPAPHLPSMTERFSPFVSYASTDGDPRWGGHVGVRRIMATNSNLYHISRFNGPLHLVTDNITITLQREAREASGP